jgi:hypothetical protein
MNYVSFPIFLSIILYNQTLDTRVQRSHTRAECVVTTEVTGVVSAFLIRWRAVHFIASLFAASKAGRGHYRNESHSHSYSGDEGFCNIHMARGA